MKSGTRLTVIFVLLAIRCAYANQRAVGAAVACEYPVWTGRFGDQLFHYVRSRWVAHRLGLPYLHRSFQYSDQLTLHTTDGRYDDYKKSFARHRVIKLFEDIKTVENNTLYGIDFFFTSKTWESWDELCTWKGVLDDPAFIDEMKRVISPIKPLSLVSVPQHVHAVAVHVRKGGGFDRPLYSQQIYRKASQPPRGYEDVQWPLKLPPDQYYIDQIKLLHEMLGGEPMYVYIFTDDRNPEKLAELYAQHTKLSNVTFDCRRTANHHASNVLEDFFSMGRFPYLIRSGSHFAQMAQLIGNHIIVIYPKHAVWDDNKLIIDQIGVYRRS